MTIQEQKHEPDTHTRPENAAKCAMYCAARVDLEKNTSIKAATLDYKVTKRAINCDFYASTAIVMQPTAKRLPASHASLDVLAKSEAETQTLHKNCKFIA